MASNADINMHNKVVDLYSRATDLFNESGDNLKIAEIHAELVDKLLSPDWIACARRIRSEVSGDVDRLEREQAELAAVAANKYRLCSVLAIADGTAGNGTSAIAHFDRALMYAARALKYCGIYNAYKTGNEKFTESMDSVIEDLADIYHRRGGIYADNGDNSKANEDYQRAINLAPPAKMKALNGNGITGTVTAQTLNWHGNEECNAKRYEVAAYLFQKSADMGNVDALQWMGFFYHEGKGVPKDGGKAKAFYEKVLAIDPNYGNALNNMGNLYRDGFGVAQDFGKAKKFYTRALRAGNEYAKSNLKRLKQMKKDAASSGSGDYSDEPRGIGSKLLGILFGIIGAVVLLAITMILLPMLGIPILNLLGLLGSPVIGFILGYKISHSLAGKLIIIAMLIVGGIFFVLFNWSIFAPYFEKAPTVSETQTVIDISQIAGTWTDIEKRKWHFSDNGKLTYENRPDDIREYQYTITGSKMSFDIRGKTQTYIITFSSDGNTIDLTKGKNIKGWNTAGPGWYKNTLTKQ